MAKLPKISERFTSAIQATDQAQRIAQLQAEIEKLRATQSPELEQQLEQLRKQLIAEEGELEIAIDLIDPNWQQPRQTLTSESI
ncbi:MAG: chromosome partitioning protein ParB, partial [Desertifilum sp. SIO1I2]|nr:chromosome partitioning protein ParB [Desertifilum sp. SIO1I2]